MLDRVEDAQAGVGRIAREQDHLDAWQRRLGRIEPKQLLHQRKRDARCKRIVLALALKRVERIQSRLFEQRMAFGHVEQRARSDRHNQAVGKVLVGHRSILPQRDHLPSACTAREDAPNPACSYFCTSVFFCKYHVISAPGGIQKP